MNSETTGTGLQAVLMASLLLLSVFAMTTPLAGAAAGTNQEAAVAGNVTLAEAASLPDTGGVTVAVEVYDSNGNLVNSTEREITNATQYAEYELGVPAGTHDVLAKITGASGDANASAYRTIDVETSGSGVAVQSGETATAVDFAVVEELNTSLQHQRRSGGAHGTTDSDGNAVVAEALKVSTVDGEPFTVGGDRDVGLTIRNADTGDQVTVVPENRSSFAATGFDLRRVYDADGSIDETPQIGIEGPDLDGRAYVNVSVVGAAPATFNSSVFASYEVDLVADATTSAPTVVNTTQPRLVGIGYEGRLAQNSTAGTIEFTFPRHVEVDETWDVEFRLHGVDAEQVSDLPQTVENRAGDEQFVARVNVSAIDSGTYTWALSMYPAEPQFGDTRQQGDRILEAFGIDDVTIERANFTFGPERADPGEAVTFNASDSVAREGDIQEYQWAFGDGNTTTTTSPTVEHAYDATGDYDVELTVVDTAGNEENTTRTVSVLNTTTIEGQFTQADGQPAVDDTVVVHVTAYDQRLVTTDDTGAFSVEVPAQSDNYSVGYYQANLTKSGSAAYFPADGNVDVHTFAVTGAEDSALGEIQLPAGHLVNASVEDQNGDPVEGARLVWVDTEPGTNATAGFGHTTNSDGRMATDDGTVFEGLEVAGPVDVAAMPPSDADRFVDHTYIEHVNATSNVDLTFTLESDGAVAAFSASSSEPAVDESVTFDASRSSADAEIQEYVWEFGDGTTTTTTDPTVDHAYGSSGDYTVSLTIRDANGNEDTTTQPVSVQAGNGGSDDSTDTGGSTDDGSTDSGTTDPSTGTTSPSTSPDDGEDSEETGNETDAESEDDESFNVTASETVAIEDAEPDEPGTTVRTTNTSVSAITFDDDDGNSSGGNVTVSDVDEPPSRTGAPEGSTVSVVEISVPEDRRSMAASLEFTVDRDRVDALEANESELTVQRYNESAGAWETLETEVVSSGDEEVVLRAETPGFSYFAVTAQDSESESGSESGDEPTPTATPDQTATETATEDGTETVAETDAEPDDQAGFGAGVSLLALLGAALVTRRRR